MAIYSAEDCIILMKNAMKPRSLVWQKILFSGIRINWFKYKDLMQLLKFISPIYHDDCKAVRHDKSEQDELFSEEIRFSTSAEEQIFVLPFFIIPPHITGCI